MSLDRTATARRFRAERGLPCVPPAVVPPARSPLGKGLGPPETAARSGLRVRYAEALAAFLQRSDARGLDDAYELGREAVAEGLGLLDLLALHRAASAPAAGGSDASATALGRSLRFLSESLGGHALMLGRAQEADAALRAMNDLLEAESRRIARALHDEAGMLAVICLDLAQAGRGESPAAAAALGRAAEHIERHRQQLRRLSHQLHPPLLDRCGLVPALRALTEVVSASGGVRIDLAAPPEIEMDAAVAATAYRVAQEALVNVARHAGASRVALRVWRSRERLHCAIRDDGVGFDLGAHASAPASGGLGMIGMRERVRALQGRFRVSSRRAAGTLVRFSLPLRLR